MEFQQSIEDQVKRAIAHREFELHFQPIASITSGQIGALEALVRCNRPQEGRAYTGALPSAHRAVIPFRTAPQPRRMST